jgi:cytochrome c-type biogenesis protein CcmH/NrfF
MPASGPDWLALSRQTAQPYSGPGGPPRLTCPDCIDRSIDGSDAQIHDTMNFIILAL